MTVDKYQHVWEDTDKENRSNRREACRSATLSATGPTWMGLRPKACFRSDGLSIDSLSHNADGIRLHIKTYKILKITNIRANE
jgi:hypothetical protein